MHNCRRRADEENLVKLMFNHITVSIVEHSVYSWTTALFVAVDVDVSMATFAYNVS